MYNLTRNGSLVSLFAVMTVVPMRVTETAGEKYTRASRLRMISG